MEIFFARRFLGNSPKLPPHANLDHSSGAYNHSIVPCPTQKLNRAPTQALKSKKLDFEILFFERSSWQILYIFGPIDYYFHVVMIFELIDLKYIYELTDFEYIFSF
jgi:hypothetical protein